MTKKLLILGVALGLMAIPALAADSSFDRHFTVNGRLDLAVNNGAGNIHIAKSQGNQVHIYGRVRSSWGVSEETVRQIAAHPPIEQTGNIIRIGKHNSGWKNVTIDYEIQAPENAILELSNGSGNVADDGVGVNAHIESGSGNIVAKGLAGGFSVETGSGNIYAEQAGDGLVRAEAGSGNLELHNLHGGLKAETGSGTIRVSGTPTSPWKIEAGSGNVEVATGSSGVTLDLEAGSGAIQVNQGMSSTSSSERHHVAGQLHGGGPMVHIETGSGTIKVD